MRNGMLTSLLALSLVACGSSSGGDATNDEDSTTETPTQALDNATVTADSNNAAPTGKTAANDPGTPPGDPASDPAGAPAPTDDPGAKPATTCSVTKDANGFFQRNGYVGYVPPSYDGSKAVPLLVAMHGCGDNAKNFATWAAAPYDTRKTQDHIGISIGGRDGQCWQAGDVAAVMAAIDDIKSCFWVHQQKVVVGGFSSGGKLAYRTGLLHADKIAGIVVEDTGLYGYGASDETMLLTGAARKLPIAHIAHQSDSEFPLSSVQTDWALIQSHGFPLTTSVVAGPHDGTSADWNTFLIPHMAKMKLP